MFYSHLNAIIFRFFVMINDFFQYGKGAMLPPAMYPQINGLGFGPGMLSPAGNYHPGCSVRQVIITRAAQSGKYLSSGVLSPAGNYHPGAQSVR